VTRQARRREEGLETGVALHTLPRLSGKPTQRTIKSQLPAFDSLLSLLNGNNFACHLSAYELVEAKAKFLHSLMPRHKSRILLAQNQLHHLVPVVIGRAVQPPFRQALAFHQEKALILAQVPHLPARLRSVRQ
jgi:hypothetical protein